MTEAQGEMLLAAIQNLQSSLLSVETGEKVLLAMLTFGIGLLVVNMFGTRWYL